MTWINYITGFILSLILTVIAYMLAVHHLFAYEPLLISLLVLACVQFAVQAVFFLHMGEASKDRLIILVWTGVIVLILIVGSLWIMSNLNQRMMPSAQQMEHYMDTQ